MDTLKGLGVLAVIAGVVIAVTLVFLALEPIGKPDQSNLSAQEAIGTNFK